MAGLTPGNDNRSEATEIAQPPAVRTVPTAQNETSPTPDPGAIKISRIATLLRNAVPNPEHYATAVKHKPDVLGGVYKFVNLAITALSTFGTYQTINTVASEILSKNSTMPPSTLFLGGAFLAFCQSSMVSVKSTALLAAAGAISGGLTKIFPVDWMPTSQVVAIFYSASMAASLYQFMERWVAHAYRENRAAIDQSITESSRNQTDGSPRGLLHAYVSLLKEKFSGTLATSVLCLASIGMTVTGFILPVLSSIALGDAKRELQENVKGAVERRALNQEQEGKKAVLGLMVRALLQEIQGNLTSGVTGIGPQAQQKIRLLSAQTGIDLTPQERDLLSNNPSEAQVDELIQQLLLRFGENSEIAKALKAGRAGLVTKAESTNTEIGSDGLLLRNSMEQERERLLTIIEKTKAELLEIEQANSKALIDNFTASVAKEIDKQEQAEAIRTGNKVKRPELTLPDPEPLKIDIPTFPSPNLAKQWAAWANSAIGPIGATVVMSCLGTVAAFMEVTLVAALINWTKLSQNSGARVKNTFRSRIHKWADSLERLKSDRDWEMAWAILTNGRLERGDLVAVKRIFNSLLWRAVKTLVPAERVEKYIPMGRRQLGQMAPAGSEQNIKKFIKSWYDNTGFDARVKEGRLAFAAAVQFPVARNYVTAFTEIYALICANIDQSEVPPQEKVLYKHAILNVLAKAADDKSTTLWRRVVEFFMPEAPDSIITKVSKKASENDRLSSLPNGGKDSRVEIDLSFYQAMALAQGTNYFLSNPDVFAQNILSEAKRLSRQVKNGTPLAQAPGGQIARELYAALV